MVCSANLRPACYAPVAIDLSDFGLVFVIRFKFSIEIMIFKPEIEFNSKVRKQTKVTRFVFQVTLLV